MGEAQSTAALGLVKSSSAMFKDLSLIFTDVHMCTHILVPVWPGTGCWKPNTGFLKGHSTINHCNAVSTQALQLLL